MEKMTKDAKKWRASMISREVDLGGDVRVPKRASTEGVDER